MADLSKNVNIFVPTKISIVPFEDVAGDGLALLDFLTEGIDMKPFARRENIEIANSKRILKVEKFMGQDPIITLPSDSAALTIPINVWNLTIDTLLKGLPDSKIVNNLKARWGVTTPAFDYVGSSVLETEQVTNQCFSIVARFVPEDATLGIGLIIAPKVSVATDAVQYGFTRETLNNSIVFEAVNLTASDLATWDAIIEQNGGSSFFKETPGIYVVYVEPS